VRGGGVAAVRVLWCLGVGGVVWGLWGGWIGVWVAGFGLWGGLGGCVGVRRWVGGVGLGGRESVFGGVHGGCLFWGGWFAG